MSHSTHFQIADVQHVKQRVDELKHRSEDIKNRLGPLLKRLWDPQRLLHSVPPSINFESLLNRFPHFREVIEYYESVGFIQSKLGLHFETIPILLVGDPGLGKTYFASELAKLMGLAFYEISLATTTAVFALNGAHIQWAEGSPGFIADTLAKSPMANPMILIDELDKCMGEAQYSAMNAFYGLLESHTAARFRDEALAIELNASKIVWVATANELQGVPEPIKSRLKIFYIQQPQKSDMALIAESIYKQMLGAKNLNGLLNSDLTVPVMDLLSSYSPRTAKMFLEEAAYKAIRDDRQIIEVRDLPMLRPEMRHVGFI